MSATKRANGPKRRGQTAKAQSAAGLVAWNMVHIEPVIELLCAEGQRCGDELLSLTTPLIRRHINPFGRYHFDLARMRQEGG
jgi:hypothetical protein